MSFNPTYAQSTATKEPEAYWLAHATSAIPIFGLIQVISPMNFILIS